MCLYPRLIQNRKYTKNKKNGGQVPPITDIRTTMVPVGCQKCIECRKQKARGWRVRLMEEIKHRKNGIFITLTFSNEQYTELLETCKQKSKEILKGYDLDNAIATLATRRFLERYRKENKKSLRHWLVTEIGGNGTEHLHLHGIVWAEDKEQDITKAISNISRHWQYGHVWPTEKDRKKNYVAERTVNYIVKYIMKTDEKHPEYISIVLTSPGMGSKYIESYEALKNTYKGKNTTETYRTGSGQKIAMPPYWRNKIYTEQQREQLWLQKLDQQVRYVCGEKVDISKGEEEYYKLVKYYRKMSKELGYGDDEKTWEQKQYENQRRSLKQAERRKGRRL